MKGKSRQEKYYEEQYGRYYTVVVMTRAYLDMWVLLTFFEIIIFGCKVQELSTSMILAQRMVTLIFAVQSKSLNNLFTGSDRILMLESVGLETLML